jgi:hypothetical protein
MDKEAKDMLVGFTWREWRMIGCSKRSSRKNWKRRNEENGPGKDEEKK